MQVTITDPEMVRKRNVDKGGRIFVGEELSGKSYRLVLEELDDTEDTD